MWIKNNSNRGWKQYNCGKGVIIDIEPKSEFEIGNAAGMILLRNLGAEAWLMQVDGPAKKVVEKPVVEKEPKKVPKKVAKKAPKKVVKKGLLSKFKK